MTENNEMTAEEIAAIEAEQARLEAEERARIEHENMLNSFPETTVFYDKIIIDDNVQHLAGYVTTARAAEINGLLDNHMDMSELTAIGSKLYIKGHEPAAETAEEKIARRAAEITDQVQELIDSTAHTRGYDNGVSCVSYEEDPDETFNAEAVAFKAWRGRCWRTCYNILASVEHGTVDVDDVTWQYVYDRLPVLEW